MLRARALSQPAGVRVPAASDPALDKAPQLPGQPDPIQLYSDHGKLLEKPIEEQP